MRTAHLTGPAILLLLLTAPALADPPDWLRDAAARAVPAQAADVDAVQLLHEVTVKVAADGTRSRRVRVALRLLRQSGERLAGVSVSYDSTGRVRDMKGWTIPTSGKPFEVGFRDTVETAVPGVDDSTLVTDTRTRVLVLPGARVGATLGYEFEEEESGPQQVDFFNFQDDIPVLQASYSLSLPRGWTVTPTWTNHAAVEAVQVQPQQWQWSLRDLPAVPSEAHMPSWQGVAGSLYLAFSPPGQTPELGSWSGISTWYAKLAEDRRAASPAMRAKVADLVKGATTPLERVRALATFVQRDVRYVAIQLGIGGHQPHAATDVFTNRFGDCKDKSTLLGVMLAEIGIDSTPILVNTDREVVRRDSTPALRFNHEILAVHLPADMPLDGLLSTIEAPGGGRWLFFDPTDEVTPVGRLPGELQSAFGLPITRAGGQLVQLPRVAPLDSGMRRTGQLKLDETGRLTGEVVESYRGDAARQQRHQLRAATRDTDVARSLRARLAGSLAQFQVEMATIRYRDTLHQPFEWHYNLQVDSYASRAGGLVLVRPRVLGVIAEDLTGEKKPRVHDVSFPGVGSYQDEFTIELPQGYAVDSLPPPLDLDIGYAAYHSRVEVDGARLKYTRSFELRDLKAPAARFEDYRGLQRSIARDERAVVMFKTSER